MFFSFLNFMFMFSYVTGNTTFQKPLTAEEEQIYIKEYENGSIEAKNILIERNLRLVAHIAKKYINNGKENEDLISIGTIGLIKAISSYDSKKSVRLATFAAKCIDNEILMYLRSCKRYNGDLYLQDPIGVDKEGNEIIIMDIISSGNDNIEEQVDLKIQSKKLFEKIKTILTKREQYIISLRYGLMGGEEITQREIAKKLGISRSYVSRIEKKAIKKLNEELNK